MKIKQLMHDGVCGIPVMPLLFLLTLPLFASLILGLIFNGKLITRVPTAIFDGDNSALSRSLVRYIESNDVFDVKARPENENDIENMIYHGDVETALIIPKNFSRDLLDNKSPRVMAIYDASQMSMAGAAKGRITEVLSTIKSGYLLKIMEGKLGVLPSSASVNIMPIGFVTRSLGNPEKNSPDFMIEGLLFSILQIAMAVTGLEIAGENRRYRDLWKRGISGSAFAGISIIFVIATQVCIFNVPFRGSLFAAILLTVPFAIGVVNLGVFFRLLTKSRASAISLCGILPATLLFSGYTFPVFAMPMAYRNLFWFMPLYHYGVPFRDVSLLGDGSVQVLPDVFWLCGFALMMVAVNWLLFASARRAGEKAALSTMKADA